MNWHCWFTFLVCVVSHVPSMILQARTHSKTVKWHMPGLCSNSANSCVWTQGIDVFGHRDFMRADTGDSCVGTWIYPVKIGAEFTAKTCVWTQILSCLDTRKAHRQNLCSDTGVCWQKFFTVIYLNSILFTSQLLIITQLSITTTALAFRRSLKYSY